MENQNRTKHVCIIGLLFLFFVIAILLTNKTVSDENESFTGIAPLNEVILNNPRN